MNNAEIFLDKYRELERAVRTVFKIDNDDSIYYYLTHESKYRVYKEDLSYCKDIRNLLSHNPKLNGKYAVMPDDATISFIENIISKIKATPRCSEISVNIDQIFRSDYDGNVLDTMLKMRKNAFSNVPIVDKDGIVVGVFNENSIFSYLSDEQIVCVDENLKFKDIQPYLGIHDRENTDFIFVDGKLYVYELLDEIQSAFNRGKKIDMAFITRNGKDNSPLLGIVTLWDIIASYGEQN